MARARNGRRKGKLEAQSPQGKLLDAYIRVSDVTGRRDSMLTDTIQEATIRGWALRTGANIGEVHPDLGLSGRSSDKRKINYLIDRVEEGKSDGVVVYKIDRWGRNHHDSMKNIIDLQNVGGVIFSATESLDDIDSPMGRFQLSQLLTMAQYVSDQIGERWRDLHSFRLDEGYPSGGGKRFGYRYMPSRGRESLGLYLPDHMLDDEDDDALGTAPAVKEMYERYIQGQSLTVVVDWLRDSGFVTTRGNQFSKSSLYNILDSGFAAGKLVVNDTDKEWGVDRRYRDGKHLPIIGADLWGAYVERRKRPAAPRTKHPVYKVSGLVWCAGCQKRMYKNDALQKRTTGNFYLSFLRCHLPAKQRAYMTCPAPARMALHKIEEAVKEWLDVHADNQVLAEVELAKRQRVTDLDADIARTKRTLLRTEERLRSMAERTALDSSDTKYLAPETFALLQPKTISEISTLREKLESLEKEQRVNTSPSDVHFKALSAAWDKLDASILNESLRKLIQAIYVFPQGNEVRTLIIGTWEQDPFTRRDGRRRQAASA